MRGRAFYTPLSVGCVLVLAMALAGCAGSSTDGAVGSPTIGEPSMTVHHTESTSTDTSPTTNPTSIAVPPFGTSQTPHTTSPSTPASSTTTPRTSQTSPTDPSTPETSPVAPPPDGEKPTTVTPPDYSAHHAATIWGKNPVTVAAAMSAASFRSAPGAVLLDEGDDGGAGDAAGTAASLGVPLLLTGNSNAALGVVIGELDRLGAAWVLPVGEAASDVAAASGLEVRTDGGDSDDPHAAAVVDGVAVLAASKADKSMTIALAAAKATAKAAGFAVHTVTDIDPRSSSDVISALAKNPPDNVIGLGPGFSSAKRLAARVGVAETGVQLPGGGQLMFPGRTLVAMYGHPSTASLGVLGAQDLPAAIKRAKKLAGDYKGLTKSPVVPAFEIIATVATGSPGANGNYSAPSSIKTLKPWVDAATDAGLYVILDLQPGRAKLIDQAKLYESLLENPHVGLALDPEWKLGPDQKPLQQIGGVDASEVNEVISWLGDLTAKKHLPQKVLVLHQFRLSMLRNESKIVTSNDNVSVLIHMDGQGSPGAKESTWDSVVAAAPKGVAFGWKNFYEMDTPMISPKKTMAHKPAPEMISYQ